MYSAIQTGQNIGMQTLDQDLKRLVNEGVIEKETALRLAVKKEDFMSMGDTVD
jgi:twitching motility protein PilT